MTGALYNDAILMIARPRLLVLPMLIAACGASWGCASSPPPPSKAEHEARMLAPIPACAVVLPNAGPSGARTSLRDEYWQLVFPAFDDSRGRLPGDALACTGRALLRESTFAGATLQSKLNAEQITLGGGADGIKAVWLRSHDAEDQSVAGAIALVRVQDDFAYVVAVGAHRGRSSARLSIDRIGDELLLLVRDESCRGRAPDDACESLLTVYLVRQGNLVEGVKLDIEKVAYGAGNESASRGPLEFHLTSSPSFVKDTMRVVEHVSVRDRLGRELRWAELERVFVVLDDRFEASEDALWSRMAPPVLSVAH